MTSTMPIVAAVTFAGASLITILHDGEEFAAIRPICDAIGLAWNGQWERISRDDILSSTVRVIRTVAQDGKEREILCLPLKLLNGWLFGVNTSRVKDDAVRARVIEYKRECYDALHSYWTKGTAINPRAYSVGPNDSLSDDQAETLRYMLRRTADKLPKYQQGPFMMRGWSRLKAHFKVGYRSIPRSEFTEAVSVVARHCAEQGELMDAEPKPGTLNETVADLVRQLEDGAPASVFMPLVNAVLKKQGFDLSSGAQMKPPAFPIAERPGSADAKRTIGQIHGVLSALQQWASTELPHHVRPDFGAALIEIDSLLITGWTEVDEALREISLATRFLKRWNQGGGYGIPKIQFSA